MANFDIKPVLYPRVTYDGDNVLFDGEHRATFVELDAPGGFTDMRLVDKVTGRAVDRMIVGSWGYQEWMRARDRGYMVDAALWRGFFRNP